MRWILLSLLFSLVRSQCNLGQYSSNGACTDCPTGEFMNRTDYVYEIPCSTLYYSTETGSFPSENAVQITIDSTGQLIFSISHGDFSRHSCTAIPTEFCPASPKTKYRLSLWDQYADTWNGAWISLYTGSPCSSSNILVSRAANTGGYWSVRYFELSPSAGSSSICYTCDKCQPGTYETAACISTTNTQCQECIGGQYQNQEDQQQCIACSTGQYSLTGASSCTLCATGTYQDQEGQTECQGCPDGQYQDQEGQASCKTCTGEYEIPSNDKKSCVLECGQGRYDRGGTCTDCEAGFYSSVTNAGAVETTNTNCNNVRTYTSHSFYILNIYTSTIGGVQGDIVTHSSVSGSNTYWCLTTGHYMLKYQDSDTYGPYDSCDPYNQKKVYHYTTKPRGHDFYEL